jgi:hypothetical protein
MKCEKLPLRCTVEQLHELLDYDPVRCERCFGTGKVEGGRVYCLIDLPCGDCGGTGEIHCEQPAPVDYDGWVGSPHDPGPTPTEGGADENYLWNEARAATAKIEGWAQHVIADTTGLTYATQTGRYTRIGDTIHLYVPSSDIDGVNMEGK